MSRGATLARYSRTPSRTRSRWVGEGLPSALAGDPSTTIASKRDCPVLPRGIVSYVAMAAPNTRTTMAIRASRIRFAINMRTQNDNRRRLSRGEAPLERLGVELDFGK